MLAVGLSCTLRGGVSTCAAGCGGDVGGGDADFFDPAWGIAVAKCRSLVAAGGLLRPVGLEKEATPLELRAGSGSSGAGLSGGGPLQCLFLCLRSMAERVKLFPQALQT